jgi:hypothetical protein
MGAVRVHRTRAPGGGFAAVPDAAARDSRLSWSARGYLAEMLTHRDDWDPETSGQAAARARRQRGSDAETPRHVRRILSELERCGYRHRVRRRRGGGSAFVNELHYYDLPTRPCEDAPACESCRRYGVSAGHPDPADTSTPPDLRKHRAAVSAGRAESADMSTPADLGGQAVSAGGAECAFSEGSENAGSSRRPSTPGDHQETKGASSASSPAAGAASPSVPDDQGQDPQRWAAELIITGYLAAWHGQDDHDVIAWQQRTFRSHLHDGPAAYARYLLRCWLAAPDLMAELADLKYDDGRGFTDDAAPRLSDLRATVKPRRLTRAQQEWCGWLAGQVDRAGPVRLTVRQAIDMGVTAARKETRRPAALAPDE